jgi:hypothetical protein
MAWMMKEVLLCSVVAVFSLAGCGDTHGTDGGAIDDAGESAMDSGMSSRMDADQPGMDGGGTSDAGDGDAGGGPTTRMALPNGGITSLGPRSSSGADYRIFDEGFETDQRRCAGRVCVSGSIRP